MLPWFILAVVSAALLAILFGSESESQEALAQAKLDRDFNGRMLMQYGKHETTCMQLRPFDSPYSPYDCDCYLSRIMK
jgi:hypothetical protein